jgi:protein-disulfide isomerase
VTLGNPDAKVTLTYLGDLQCPICKVFTLTVFPTFVQREVKTGHVKVVYRSSCTASCNNTSVPNAQRLFNTQQVAAYAAGKQGKFWNYAELFYHQQGTEDTPYVTEAYMTGLAKQIPGLNVAKWQSDRKDTSLLSQVNSDEAYAVQEAKAAAQPGPETPTFVMQGPKGAEVVQGSFQGYGFPSPTALEKAVATVS